MSMIRDFAHRLGMHNWQVPEGDDYGAHWTCSYCGKVKRLYPDGPADAHDNLGLHQ